MTRRLRWSQTEGQRCFQRRNKISNIQMALRDSSFKKENWKNASCLVYCFKNLNSFLVKGKHSDWTTPPPLLFCFMIISLPLVFDVALILFTSLAMQTDKPHAAEASCAVSKDYDPPKPSVLHVTLPQSGHHEWVRIGMHCYLYIYKQ